MFFHPRLIIDQHFDALINRIDIKTEELLKELVEHETINTEKSKILNDLREKQIKQIHEVKELNLKPFEQFKHDEYETKWSNIINDSTLEYIQKIDQIKEEIISVDCVLLEKSKAFNGLDLWITNWFHTATNLEILK
jgi:hypothetical protein